MKELKYKVFDTIVISFVGLGWLACAIAILYLMYDGIPDDSPFWTLVNWIKS
jgi:hypothetical protein